MALHGTLILNGADYAPFNLYGVGVFMAHSGQELIVIRKPAEQLKGQDQSHWVNTGLSTGVPGAFLFTKGQGAGPVEQSEIRCGIWP